MISIYKNQSISSFNLQKIDSMDPGSWINLVSPTDQELILTSKKTKIPLEFLKSALDDEESSRLDIEDEGTLILIDIPFTAVEENSLTYDTYPLAIIHTDSFLVTVCLKNTKILTDFINDKIKSFYTFKRSRFILQILYRVASYYLFSLRQIEKKSLMLQSKLHKSMSNKILMQLLSLQNSIVYFSTSLKANNITLNKITKLEFIHKYEEDMDLLEDVIIESKQATEMTEIYGNILQATMDTSANIINNNLNAVMKLLTSLTMALSIPNIISGIFGMNISGLPFSDHDTGPGFPVMMLIIISVTSVVIYLLKRKGLFK